MTPNPRPIGEDDIQAFIDCRLAPGRQQDVDSFLAFNPALRTRVEEHRADAQALRTAAQHRPPEPVPASLRVAELRLHRAKRKASGRKRLAAGVCIFALGTALGTALSTRDASTGAVRMQMTDALVAYRAFVGPAGEAVEVPATQSAALRQMVAQHLKQEVAIPDLSAVELVFRGGRLLSSDEGPGGMFFYDEPEGSRIALYIKTLSGPRHAALTWRRDGDVVAYFWYSGKLGYGVVGPAGSTSARRAAEYLSSSR